MDASCAEFLASGLSDWSVNSVGWDGNDLLICVSPPAADGSPPRVIRFVWAHRVKVQLDFERYMGPPMLWKSSIATNDDGSFAVVLDFGGSPRGEIALTCNDLSNDGSSSAK